MLSSYLIQESERIEFEFSRDACSGVGGFSLRYDKWAPVDSIVKKYFERVNTAGGAIFRFGPEATSELDPRLQEFLPGATRIVSQWSTLWIINSVPSNRALIYWLKELGAFSDLRAPERESAIEFSIALLDEYQQIGVEMADSGVISFGSFGGFQVSRELAKRVIEFNLTEIGSDTSKAEMNANRREFYRQNYVTVGRL